MKVGDYVRTVDGIIAKIIDLQENPYKEKTIYVLDKEIYIKDLEMSDEYLMLNPFTEETTNKIDTHFWDEKIITKQSPNIIDLIEVEDYVNGKKVIDTFTDYIFDYSEEFKVIRFSETDILHDVKHIKSIVTHEQFERMQYNLESEVN